MPKSLMKYLVIVATGLAVSGCQLIDTSPGPPPERIEVTDVGTEAERAPDEAAPPGRVAREVAFPEAEYAALEKHGSGSISGRLTLNTASGTLVGRNSRVSVAPVTTYSAEAAEKALAGQAVEPADPRAQAYTRQASTDDDGRFTVNGLPAGDYYVSGSVTPSDGRPRIIINQVRLNSGQRVNVNLSR
ncbi:carboxypeptidase-like regulatory domain-containing protein [Halomonas salipaludis]|nr:carboxypeptidase-like regulatory domain-containing protein [Halomonas salipaludis]